MGISVNDIVTGRKTFFILPDTSLMPESYLEDYFAIGYECYYVPFDKRVNIQKKVKDFCEKYNINLSKNQVEELAEDVVEA